MVNTRVYDIVELYAIAVELRLPEKKVRRERMGHITLAVPVVHIWYLRSIPSKLSYLAGKSTKELERVIYYEMFMVIEPGASGLDKFTLLEEDEYFDYEDQFGYMAVSEDDIEIMIIIFMP